LGESETKKAKNQPNSEKERTFRERRCDIVCRCELEDNGDGKKNGVYALYFDIEMQRTNTGDPIRRFLEYQKLLENKYSEEVIVIAFLNYRTEQVVENTAMGRIIEDPKTGKRVAAPEEEKAILQPMIGLEKATSSILKNEDIEIMKNKKIGQKGKEWLKLLGIQWWAEKEKDEKGETGKSNEYYVVPRVSDGEIKGALEALEKANVKQEFFQAEVDRIFDEQKILDEEKEKSRQEGKEEGEKSGFDKG
jgi:hypothetical protein